jgi:hypothetical protein
LQPAVCHSQPAAARTSLPATHPSNSSRLLGETADGSLLHIELQSTNDPAMPLRMAEYCLRVYRMLGKFPHSFTKSPDTDIFLLYLPPLQ